jgi:membrane-bound lytic murein transglycosylase F
LEEELVMPVRERWLGARRQTAAIGLLVGVTALMGLFCADTAREEERAQGEIVTYEGEPYRGTLAAIREKEMLRVLTPEKEWAALPRKGAILAFEVDMARRLASRLGVALAFVYAPRYDSIIPMLAAGRADVAMASLTVTESRKAFVDFSSPLGYVRELLMGSPADTAQIHSVADLGGRTVHVRPSSSYYRTLLGLKDSVSALSIQPAPEDLHTHEIVHKVARGTYPLTACDSDIADAVLEYETNVVALLPLTDYRPRAWAVAKECDSLRAALNAFILEESLTPHRRERYQGDLPEIKKRRTLRVATRNNAATYWIHRGEEVGFEYELCRAFAEEHDLRLEMRVAPDRSVLLDWVINGEADIAAACLTVTERRLERVKFCEPYLFPVEVIVSRLDSAGNPLVADTSALFDVPVYVRRSSSYYGTLRALGRARGDSLDIRLVPEEMETEEILRKVADGEYAATVCDDYLARLEQRYDERLHIGPSLTGKRRIAWAAREDAVELCKAIDEFFTESSYRPRALRYNILYRRYFKRGRYVVAARSEERADLHGRLSPFDPIMRRYATQRGFDWRMIAAQVYQESKFNPRARSWAGARGLMQLMPSTARELGVKELTDPSQNVAGGTLYMKRMLERFDPRIPYQERYHLALASYNAGYGHVADARVLAEELGHNPDIWFGNVEKAMLLLSKREYAKRARHGYVRGSEPVTYVSNIRSLYNHYSEIR